MQALAKNVDSTVAIITLFPTSAMRLEDGVTFTDLGQRRYEPTADAPAGRCVIFGTAREAGLDITIVIGDADYDVADLTPTSVAGFELVFPDVQRDIISKWHVDARDKVVSVHTVAKADIPQNRSFRNAWRHEGKGKLQVDMAAAGVIQQDRLRRQRDALFPTLDAKYMKALEAGDKKAMQVISAEKQALRDAPANLKISAAKTPEELLLVEL